VVERVTSASELRVVVPETASSSKDVIALLTVSPHTPDNSPVTGRAKPKSGVDAVVIRFLYCKLSIGVQPADSVVSTAVQPAVSGLLITAQFSV
jgi:hypothetical protein